MSPAEATKLQSQIARRKMTDTIFGVLGAFSIVIGLGVLAILLIDLLRTGMPRLSWEFFTSFPSRRPAQAGILSAWVGSMLIMLVTMLCALPLGVAAGVYLEEYARKTKLAAIIEINIANLAGVPSIVWGLMALGVFVHQFNFGATIKTAGLTLGLLVLPIVIIAT
ncbi:MAG: phosphate ABC transporter, permease protein PstA, partial [Anaerolineae bacterium]|nr:phosphate ABC transporter, permease protein PstA [Phycisphaerae bacterium]